MITDAAHRVPKGASRRPAEAPRPRGVIAWSAGPAAHVHGADAELGGARAHAVDHVLDVLAALEPDELHAALDLVPADPGCERLVLELLGHRFGREIVDA